MRRARGPAARARPAPCRRCHRRALHCPPPLHVARPPPAPPRRTPPRWRTRPQQRPPQLHPPRPLRRGRGCRVGAFVGRTCSSLRCACVPAAPVRGPDTRPERGVRTRALAGLVAVGGHRRDLRQVVAVRLAGDERGVPAGRDVTLGQVDVGIGLLQLRDLLEAGLYEVDGQRRVADRAHLPLAFADRVVDEVRDRLALGRGHLRIVRTGRQQHVRVRRQRVRARIVQRVDVREVLQQIVGRVAILVDVRPGQRDGDVVLAGECEVPTCVAEFRDGPVLVEGVGELVVTDRAVGRRRRDEVHDAVRARLGDRGSLAGVELRQAVVPHERSPQVGELLVEVVRQVRRRPGALGVDHRDDREAREHAAVVVGRDRGIGPVGDLVGEDLHQRLSGKSEVADELAPHADLVGERRAARDDRQVRVGAAARRVGFPGHRIEALEPDLGDAEVGGVEAEVLATLSGSARREHDLQPALVHIRDPLLHRVRNSSSSPSPGSTRAPRLSSPSWSPSRSRESW